MTLHYTNLKTDIDFGADVSSADRSDTNESGIYRTKVKRALDILLVLASSWAVAPVVLLMAVAVALDGKNPFYSQERVGKHGKSFRIWKIRTMTSDADERLESYLASNPAAREEWDLHQKLKNDPRITKVGQFLRSTSLDELPQLWNVFEGTMSVVGPRPMMLDQQSAYFGSAYYRLRPGITGLWQISDRNESLFTDRVTFDETYDKTVSFKTDIKTIFQTVAVVFRRTGY